MRAVRTSHQFNSYFLEKLTLANAFVGNDTQKDDCHVHGAQAKQNRIPFPYESEFLVRRSCYKPIISTITLRHVVNTPFWPSQGNRTHGKSRELDRSGAVCRVLFEYVVLQSTVHVLYKDMELLHQRGHKTSPSTIRQGFLVIDSLLVISFLRIQLLEAAARRLEAAQESVQGTARGRLFGL